MARVTDEPCAAVNQQQPRCPQGVENHDRYAAHKQLFMNLVGNERKKPSRPQGNRGDRLHEDVVDSAPQQKDGCGHDDCGYEEAGRTIGCQLISDLLKSVSPRREFLAHFLRQIYCAVSPVRYVNVSYRNKSKFKPYHLKHYTPWFHISVNSSSYSAAIIALFITNRFSLLSSSAAAE